MASNATLRGASHKRKLTTAAACVSGEIYQMPDGRAGVRSGKDSIASGDEAEFSTAGVFEVQKTASVVLLDGGKVYWDHSANTATYRNNGDRDFYLGTAVGDAASAAATVNVNINVEPCYTVDMARDSFTSVIAGTAAAGAFGFPRRQGSAHVLELTATSEVQKGDILSDDGFDINANAIVEFAVDVVADGSGTASDFNIGLASGTHATDFESVAEFVAIHLDENALDILVHSDDGTTDTALVDSTVNYAEGTRFEGWIDCRDPSDVQVYIDGVLVLGASDFALDGGSGPLFLVAHLEKTTGTDTYEVKVDWLRARIAEV